ncbi:DUF1501 domain-containing protein [Pseudanabaenaceae cyanobacterium LEGE 13415]|nr:DUF1501 domain-containing protein [Pseudanabaenaceae cyanobacterium LEGE 13415]
MHRRHFLKAGLCSASTFIAISADSWAFRSNAQSSNNQRLIVVFLRGAIDGLSVIVPYRETLYYEARPRIAIPQPGKEGGAIALDDRFGLHPSLATLMPLWNQKTLAFVQSCGSPNNTRSHFDAQDYMESGTPGTKSTPEGWMNRLLSTLSGRNPIQAVNVGTTTPRILAGQMPVATLASGRRATNRLVLDRPQVSQAFDRLYSNTDTLSQSYQEGKAARQALMQDLETEMQMANNGAALPDRLAVDAQRLARVMVRDARVELGFLAVGGWDTHINQGSERGQLANRLQALGRGLATLQQELGSAYNQTTILVMSEFGRTVRENGNGGTDHGHGNVMWVMGGRVRGGQLYGEWRGLEANQLNEGRDLPVVTDFRDVVISVLERQMALKDQQLNRVFPNYRPAQKIAIVS